jgi:hypothetical protein
MQRTPGGRPTQLAEATLPIADAMIYLAPHPGQGRLLPGCIDPSVIDEADPLSIDPSLNPFDPGNGYSRDAGATRYSREFVARYREAQRARVARIDDACPCADRHPAGRAQGGQGKARNAVPEDRSQSHASHDRVAHRLLIRITKHI